MVDRDGPVAHNDTCKPHDTGPNSEDLRPLACSDVNAPVTGPPANRGEAAQDCCIGGNTEAEAAERDSGQ